MGFTSLFGILAKGKILAMILVSVTLVGGTTAIMATTPTGQQVVHSITGAHTPTSAQTKIDVTQAKGNQQSSQKVDVTVQAQGNKDECRVQSETQQMASKFSLSADSIQVICELRGGTFKGTVMVNANISTGNGATVNITGNGININVSTGNSVHVDVNDMVNVNVAAGSVVTSNHVFTSAEIEQILVSAQHLAMMTHNKLNSSNIRSFVAIVLKGCGTKQMAACAKVIVQVSVNGVNVTNNGKPITIPTFPVSIPTPPIAIPTIVIPTPSIPHP